MNDLAPWLLLSAFFGGMMGFAMGLSTAKNRWIAAAHEDELLREVRRRRMTARLHDEIEKEVDQEAGPKPTAF